MTLFQLAPPAKAPWTSTIFFTIGFFLLMFGRTDSSRFVGDNGCPDMNSSSLLFGATRSWHALAQSSRQSNLVVLFVDQDLANLFAHGIFRQLFALADPLAIIPNSFSFVFEIELQHLVGFF